MRAEPPSARVRAPWRASHRNIATCMSSSSLFICAVSSRVLARARAYGPCEMQSLCSSAKITRRPPEMSWRRRRAGKASAKMSKAASRSGRARAGKRKAGTGNKNALFIACAREARRGIAESERRACHEICMATMKIIAICRRWPKSSPIGASFCAARFSRSVHLQGVHFCTWRAS